MKRTFLRCLAALAALAPFAIAPHAQAQASASWPDKPIKLVVPYAPGGLTDALARAVAEPLSRALGQAVVIDNKPGAGTLLGAQLVARSPADGYTLLMATSTTLGISPALYRNNMVDPVRDFAPVSLVATVPFFLVVRADKGWNSLQEVVDAARKASAPLQYGSAGNGSPHHLAMEMMRAASGAKFDHIPYKGSGLAIGDLLSGRFDLMVTDLTPALGHVRAGKLKILATTGPRRSAMLPEAATFAEAGLPGVEAVAWQGIVAPAGTPRPVVDRLAAEIARIVTGDAMKARCATMGCDALVPTSPADFAEMVKNDLARWTRVVNDSGAKLD